ncbi:hypothetical protein HBI56_100750 [Parastagonospora nodorum]|nr:hypothetical protein HBH53_178360 [Parastagonospora nodorum]KAH4005862.1 hypothetical protein HBI10_023330 [Parastagonospora nodorum]KAH4012005.1 hypothetical protein HBI13_193690 [Parastagonospora nodorum]KAH4175971.1 hypothetical protein HBH43_069360 [Parastagonospora nodorum]KAH4270446.1 hypothetical protein HBI03_040400 [Parastagonospora nodorum]
MLNVTVDSTPGHVGAALAASRARVWGWESAVPDLAHHKPTACTSTCTPPIFPHSLRPSSDSTWARFVSCRAAGLHHLVCTRVPSSIRRHN